MAGPGPEAWWEHPFMASLERESRDKRRRAASLSLATKQFDQSEWAAARDLNPGAHLTLNQVENLKGWFNVIDADGSGDISLMELADPLLTTGLADSIQECVEIFRVIDEDGSGEIDFEEFLDLVAIKSSGRLDRVRSREMRNQAKRNAGVHHDVVEARCCAKNQDKTKGVLAMLGELKKDEHNTLSLTTAIGAERRKFLINAVMRDASRYRVKFPKQKFDAIKALLFAGPKQRRESLNHASADGAKRQASPFWRHSNVGALPEGSPSEQVSRVTTTSLAPVRQPAVGQARLEAQRAQRQSPSRRIRAESSALPKTQRVPIKSRKPLLSKFRASLSTGPLEREQDKFLEMQRLRDEMPVLPQSQRQIHGANTAVNRSASARALHGKDLHPFASFLRGEVAPHATEMDKILQESPRDRLHRVFERFHCSPEVAL